MQFAYICPGSFYLESRVVHVAAGSAYGGLWEGPGPPEFFSTPQLLVPEIQPFICLVHQSVASY